MTFSEKLGRKLRMALIGGGGSGFIGRVHATAATLDNRAELVAGVLSSDPVKARAVAPDFGIPVDRAYGSVQELLDGETRRPTDDRVDFLSIATPNNTHYPIAKAALEAGFDVVCDKPMTTSLADAESLAAIVKQTGAVFVLTHNYTGYPMIRQAREMIQQGELGDLYAFRVNYIQGWLQGLEPGKVPARGAWKSDPEKTGPAGALGDVGTRLPGDAQPIGDVLADRHVRKQAEALEYHVGRPHFGPQLRHLGAADFDAARGRRDEAADHPQKRRLAAARGPEDGEKVAAVNVEVERLDRLDGAKVLRDVAQPHECGLGAAGPLRRSRGWMTQIFAHSVVVFAMENR